MGKTIIITGSTDGIGKLTAIALAKQGHVIFVHGRSEVKVKKVIAEIKATTDNQEVKGFVADFSDLEAVKKMAKKINNEVPTIDVLINNAGIFKSNTCKNANGLDIRLTVNYLAPYTLTNAILDTIKQSTAPRIINLSSAAQAPVEEAVLLGKQTVTENNSYAQSKLALTMWSFHLAKQEPSITTIAVNPGSLLNTKMANEAYGQHWSPAEKGVELLVDLALNKEFLNDSGTYFDNDKGAVRGHFDIAHSDAYDALKIKNLLHLTAQIINE